MKKDFKFTLQSNFGMFHWGLTKGDVRVSNLFISKTEVMGILGAIIGLRGYEASNVMRNLSYVGKRKKDKDESWIHEDSFFKKLANIELAILPNYRPHYIHDTLVHRSMKHVNVNGGLTVNLSILEKPSFIIYVKGESLSDEMYEKITRYLSNNEAEYLPYMGKNSYPCSVEEFAFVELEEKEVVSVDTKLIEMESIFPLQALKDKSHVNLSRRDRVHSDKKYFSYMDEVKQFVSEDAKIEFYKVIWTNKKVALKEQVNYYQDKNTGAAMMLI